MAINLDEVSYDFMDTSQFSISIVECLPSPKVVEILIGLFDRFTSLTPDRFDPYEPVKSKYSRDSFVTLGNSNKMSTSLMLKGKERCYTLHRSSSDGEFWSLDCELNKIPLSEITSISDILCGLPLNIATLHVVSKSEMEYCKSLRLGWMQGSGYSFNAISRYSLASGFPTLAWRTYFGPMYIRHFGKDRLLSAPAFSVKEVHPDVISIQLTESIQTIDTDWQQFHAVRLKVIEHLGVDNFQRPRGPNDPPRLETEYPNMPSKLIPPELMPLRKKMDENRELERQKTLPHAQIESIEEMLKNPKRFRVASQLVNKNQPERFVIDDYREEFIRFPDAETRNRVADQLIQAGAFFQDIAKYQGWTRASKPLPAVDGPVPASDKQKYNTRLLKNIT